MNIVLKIYVIISSIIGTITLLWLIFGLIYITIHTFKEKKDMKQQMNEFKEAIKQTGLGKDINKSLTDEERELLNKTGHFEVKETIDMETLKVKKEIKN